MLIDMSGYTGQWALRNLRGNTLVDLLGRMNRYGVDMTIVSNLNAIFYVDAQSGNEELHHELVSNAALKDRFITFATINPILPWWKESLAICQEEYGMKGIRIFPVYNDYGHTDDHCIDIVNAGCYSVMTWGIPLGIIGFWDGS